MYLIPGYYLLIRHSYYCDLTGRWLSTGASTSLCMTPLRPGESCTVRYPGIGNLIKFRHHLLDASYKSILHD